MTDEVVSWVQTIFTGWTKSFIALGYNDLSSIRAAYVAGCDATLLALSRGETAKQITEVVNRIDGRLI